MRAFAGESQARNRYTFAAEEAKKTNHEVLEKVFLFTGEQAPKKCPVCDVDQGYFIRLQLAPYTDDCK